MPTECTGSPIFLRCHRWRRFHMQAEQSVVALVYVYMKGRKAAGKLAMARHASARGVK
jgi:hypothetical protein